MIHPNGSNLCVHVFFPFFIRLCFISDQSLIVKGAPVKSVFFADVVNELNKMNYFEAERLCDIFGAILASLDQLTAAYMAGLNQCK